MMKVLVTGGTGVVGRAAVDHLIRAGHTVRLLSRHAEEDARRWPEGVEPRQGDVADAIGIAGAAEGCDVVLHVAGIVAEQPPEVTFERVNVEGTRNLVREARQARVRRFIYVSSLGAERGASEYHRSKRAAEEVVRAEAAGDWLIARPGNVYGPGDEVISLLLKMVRSLPAIPVIGSGDQPFQPAWAEDVGEALARAVAWGGPWNTVWEMAGPDVTTTSDLLDRMERITDRHPVRLPVPEFLARAGTKAAEMMGLDIPISTDQLVMLSEANVIAPGRPNALTQTLGVTPTSLDDGLRQLADALLEQLPEEGSGALHRERFWADIHGSRLSAEEVLLLVRDQFATLPPEGLLEVAPETGQAPARLEQGATLTLAVPVRGHVQVRVQEVVPRAITSVTLEGHFFAGVIRFLVEEPAPGVVRFEVRAYTRAADALHQIATRTVGKIAQESTWRSVVEEVVRRSGGTAPDGVRSSDEALAEDDASDVERWTKDLVTQRERDEAPRLGEGEPPRR